MADGKKKSDKHGEVAKAIMAKLPKALRDRAVVVEGSGAYTLIQYGGRTAASVRARSVRVTIAHDASPQKLAEIGTILASLHPVRPGGPGRSTEAPGGPTSAVQSPASSRDVHDA